MTTTRSTLARRPTAVGATLLLLSGACGSDPYTDDAFTGAPDAEGAGPGPVFFQDVGVELEPDAQAHHPGCESDDDCPDDEPFCRPPGFCCACADDDACEVWERCVEGICLPRTCEQGATRCERDDLAVCVGVGQWEVRPCAPGACEEGGCASCVAESTACTADGIATCEADGSAFSAGGPGCEAPTRCFRGACLSCDAAGEPACAGDSAGVCSLAGELTESTDCAAEGQACVAGECSGCGPNAPPFCFGGQLSCEVGDQTLLAEDCEAQGLLCWEAECHEACEGGPGPAGEPFACEGRACCEDPKGAVRWASEPTECAPQGDEPVWWGRCQLPVCCLRPGGELETMPRADCTVAPGIPLEAASCSEPGICCGVGAGQLARLPGPACAAVGAPAPAWMCQPGVEPCCQSGAGFQALDAAQCDAAGGLPVHGALCEDPDGDGVPGQAITVTASVDLDALTADALAAGDPAPSVPTQVAALALDATSGTTPSAVVTVDLETGQWTKATVESPLWSITMGPGDWVAIAHHTQTRLRLLDGGLSDLGVAKAGGCRRTLIEWLPSGALAAGCVGVPESTGLGRLAVRELGGTFAPQWIDLTAPIRGRLVADATGVFAATDDAESPAPGLAPPELVRYDRAPAAPYEPTWATLAALDDPYAPLVSDGRGTLYAGVGAAVRRLEASTGQRMDDLQLPSGGPIDALALDPSGASGQLWAVRCQSDDVLRVDLATGDVAPIDLIADPIAVAPLRDGRAVVATGFPCPAPPAPGEPPESVFQGLYLVELDGTASLVLTKLDPETGPSFLRGLVTATDAGGVRGRSTRWRPEPLTGGGPDTVWLGVETDAEAGAHGWLSLRARTQPDAAFAELHSGAFLGLEGSALQLEAILAAPAAQPAQGPPTGGPRLQSITVHWLQAP